MCGVTGLSVTSGPASRLMVSAGAAEGMELPLKLLPVSLASNKAGDGAVRIPGVFAGG